MSEYHLLSFPGTPKAVQSFRFTMTGRKYQPSNVVNWKRWIAIQARQHLGESFQPLTGPVMIHVQFRFAPPKSWSKKKLAELENGGTIWKITKPDLTDNLMKGFIDALSGITWMRDQQICHVISDKVYHSEPSIELYFKEL